MMDTLPRISAVRSQSAGLLRIEFVDGSSALLDLYEYIKRGQVFAKLSDPEYAGQYEIVDDGRVLRWPGELDFCADLIYEDAIRTTTAKPIPDSSRI